MESATKKRAEYKNILLEDKELKRFVEQIKKLYKPNAFFLFGSRAANRAALKESDYDILIVSDSFSGVPFTDRLTKIFKLWRLKSDIECIALTPEEYEKSKNSISLVPKIIKEGIAL